MEKTENQFNWEWNNTPKEQPIDLDIQQNQNNELDNQNNQEINTLNWEDKNDSTFESKDKFPNLESPVIEKPQTSPSEVDYNPIIDNNSDLKEEIEFIGRTNELYYHGDLFNIKLNNLKILEDINNLDLKTIDDNGRHEFNPSGNSELGKLIHIILKICMTKNLKIIDSSIIKTKPNESFLNINKGKPHFNFIYFAQSSQKSGEVIIDFSSIGGPSFRLNKPPQGELLMIPGWIPYRISKNQSNEDNILITGMIN